MSESEGAPWFVWLGLFFITCVSFWCQATVTEERFVPALNVIANKFNIPDDVAGATLMAAGASSPELFSSFVSLFITHSSLGLGTIVGSEIFNQLIICAGAIWAAKSGELQLDRAIVIREVGFYALSIGLLMYALHDRESVDDDEVGNDHIFISFLDACVLFGAYIAYVLVCANFPAICAMISRSERSTRSKRASLNVPGMPFLTVHEQTDEPAENFLHKELCTYFVEVGGGPQTLEGNTIDETSSLLGSSSVPETHRASALENSLRNTIGFFSDGASARRFNFLIDTEKPSDQHEIHDLEINTFEETLSCFMWQRSYFYDKAKFGTHGWYLRWFTFTRNSIYSVADRANFEKHKIHYPNFAEVEMDESRLIIKVKNPLEGRHDFLFMVPSKEIFDAVVRKCERIVELLEDEAQKHGKAVAEVDPDDEDDPESHGSLIEFPTGGSNFEVICHIVLFPIKLLMHCTVPDVRSLDERGIPTAGLGLSFFAAFSCLCWLIVGSYAMVASLEKLADLMNIPDAVIGVTVSAAGTSLPNYIASKIAAEKGFGNMAVSNAFGSNTFNILVGLGLPWFLYTSLATNFEPYHGLRDDGILESVTLLSIVLLIFVVLLLKSGFKLYKWHANLFVVLYVAYLLVAIIPVYI